MAGLLRMGSIRSTKKRVMEFDIFNKPLSNEWVVEMRDKTKILWDIESIHIPWWAAHENFNEPCTFIDHQKQDLDVWKEIFLISDTCQNSLKKVSQLITNCIVSFTTFITICEVYVKKNFSHNQDIFLEWNKKSNSYTRVLFITDWLMSLEITLSITRCQFPALRSI